MQKDLFGFSDTINIAELAPSLPHHSAGAEQLESYLANPEQQARARRVSMIASVDSFYWQAIRNQCNEATKGIDMVTGFAEDNKIPLILATVPE